MDISRRNAVIGAVLAGAVGSSAAAAAAAAPAPAKKPAGPVAGPRPSGDNSHWTNPTGAERIAMVMYPGMTALDLIGPQYFFATMRGAKVDMVAATRDPLLCDRNITMVPTATYDDVPADVDVLFVPGAGLGTLTAMEDEKLLAFLADRGSRARFVTSVCTGSLVLGAAGLLKGYRATSHWKARETLPAFGAIPVNARFVEDRNRITGGGVTAGIDFGLRLVDRLRGPDHARVLQLIGEYDPQPPYTSGTPEKAWPETANFVRSLLPGFNQTAMEIGRRRIGAL